MAEEAKVTVEIEYQDLGEIGYTAYRDQAGGVSLVSGQPIPEWGSLPDPIREAWFAAGAKVGLTVATRIRDVILRATVAKHTAQARTAREGGVR